MAEFDQKYYDVVATELSQNDIKSGLWTRAIAMSGSEDSKTKSEYIRLRVAQLKEQEDRDKPPVEKILAANKVPELSAGLKLFCFFLIVVIPLSGIWKTYIFYKVLAGNFDSIPSSKLYFATRLLIVAGIACYGFFVGLSISKRHPTGRTLGRLFLLAYFLACVVIVALDYHFWSDLAPKVDFSFKHLCWSYSRPNITMPVIFCVFYWWAFKTSKDVISIYGPEKP